VCTRRLDRQWRSGSLVISPTLTFTQIVTCYNDQRNSSLLSAAQITTRLNVRLSARLSLQIDNENFPKPGCENGDTVTFFKPFYNS
jgi:putative salt-induced outer membrane protein